MIGTQLELSSRIGGLPFSEGKIPSTLVIQKHLPGPPISTTGGSHLGGGMVFSSATGQPMNGCFGDNGTGHTPIAFFDSQV